MTKHRLLNVKETAEILGISTKTIYNCLSKPDGHKTLPLKARKIGRAVRFLEQDVIRFCEGI